MDIWWLIKLNLFSLQRGNRNPEKISDLPKATQLELKTECGVKDKSTCGKGGRPGLDSISGLPEATSALHFPCPYHEGTEWPFKSLPNSTALRYCITDMWLPISFNAYKNKHIYHQVWRLKSNMKQNELTLKQVETLSEFSLLTHHYNWTVSLGAQWGDAQKGCRVQLWGSHTLACSVITQHGHISKHG